MFIGRPSLFSVPFFSAHVLNVTGLGGEGVSEKWEVPNLEK